MSSPHTNKTPQAPNNEQHLDVLIVDWQGGLRGKRLPASLRQKILNGAARMPLSTQTMDVWADDCDPITGLALSQGDPDGLCIPDTTGFHEQPWNTNSEQILCTLHTEQGIPSEFDVRALLQTHVDSYHRRKLNPVVAVELEFYLLEGSSRISGVPQVPERLSVAGQPNDLQLYDMRALDRVTDVMHCIHAYANAMNIPAETTLAEFGPGQFEINLCHHSNPVQAADHAVLFKQLVDRAAHKHGLMATFMAKPYTEHGGSGQHIHVSVLDDNGHNIFDQGDEAQPTRLLHAVAGCLSHLEASQLVLAPHGNSYRRLQPDNFAPVRRDWGYDHRGVAIRLPETRGKAARLEHRLAGADANPYLVLSVVLAAILSGLDNADTPQQAPLLAGETPQATPLTHDWLSAIDQFEKSPWIRSVVGARFCDIYSRIKRHEAGIYNRQVTDMDLKTYLPRV